MRKRKVILTLLLVCLVAPLSVAEPRSAYFLEDSKVDWKAIKGGVTRWKTLVGGTEGGQIDDADIQFGVFELAPQAIYHRHRHAAPEVYYVTGGKSEWTIGSEKRTVGAGMTVRIPANTEHKMVNLGDEVVTAIWIWWAPGGDNAVFAGEYKFTEPEPAQPSKAVFDEKSTILFD